MKYVAIAILAIALGTLFGRASVPDTWASWATACAGTSALLCGVLAYPRRKLAALRGEAHTARTQLADALGGYRAKHGRTPRALKPRRGWGEPQLTDIGEGVGGAVGGTAGSVIGVALEVAVQAAGKAVGEAFYKMSASAARQADDRAIAQLVARREVANARLRLAIVAWAAAVFSATIVAVLAFFWPPGAIPGKPRRPLADC